MEMTIAIISILVITPIVFLVNKISPLKICPVCAGVSGTWIWMLAAAFLGFEMDLTTPAIFMGGSIVGIAYQLEKKSSRTGSAALLWKTIFIIVGFIAVYNLVMLAVEYSFVKLAVFSFIVVALIILSSLHFKEKNELRKSRDIGGSSPQDKSDIWPMKKEDLKENLKKCC